MKSIQRLVVAVLLGVWCFPAVSLAAPLANNPSTEVGSRPSSGSSPAQPSGSSPAQPSTQTEESALAAREKQSQDLQNFKGGAVVYIGGATLILVILLLILIV